MLKRNMDQWWFLVGLAENFFGLLDDSMEM